jgi:hypothetical protein
MATDRNSSILLGNPLLSLTLGAVIFAVLGLILLFTAVGAIVGLPLIGVAILLAILASRKANRSA